MARCWIMWLPRPETFTYLLEHKYCEASLSFQLLKNGDWAVADWHRPWLKLILIFMLETSNLLNTGQLIIIMAAMRKQNTLMNLLAQCNSMQALMDPTVTADSLKMPPFADKSFRWSHVWMGNPQVSFSNHVC